MKETIKSYAKVNLGLHVVGKTKKGYHKLKMIMSLIDLYDEITFEECNDVVVETNIHVCSMENNLCYKIAMYLREKYKISKGIKIFIKKNVPDGGGLGGGSSNAATVLKFLNEYWGLKLSSRKLNEVGFKFGCDIPFFLFKGISMVSGYGEIIKPLRVQEQNDKILLIFPNFRCSTKEVFDNFEGKSKNRNRKLLRGLYALNYKKYIFNDLENTVNKITNNAIQEIKEKIMKYPEVYPVMSGSGSTIIVYFDNSEKIYEIQKGLEEKLPDCKIIVSNLKMY